MNCAAEHEQNHLAYLAGLVDGEACLSFRKSSRGYSTELTIKMIHRPVLERVRSRFGGSLRPVRKDGLTRPTCRPLWKWRLFGQPAMSLVRLIEPYLIVKKEEAAVLIECHETMSSWGLIGPGRRRTPDQKAYQESVDRRLRVLKRFEYQHEGA